MVSLQSQLVLKEHDGSELRGVVLDVEAILLALDDGVEARHTDVVDSDLRLVASSELELRLLRSHCQQVHISRVVLVERHRFEQDVVVRVASDVLVDVDYLEDLSANLEGVGVHLLADLALKTLPVEGPDTGSGSRLRAFLLLLRLQPVLETGEVDETDGAFALASHDQRVLGSLVRAPADSALNVLLLSLSSISEHILCATDSLGLFQFLLVKLFGTHLQSVTPEVLDSESHPSELDSVEFLNLVVVLA